MKLLNAILGNETIQAIDKLLGEEIVGQVDNLLKDFSLDVSKEKLIPKTKFDSEREKITQLETQIKERDTQLEGLKKTAGSNEELAKQIKDLQTANETAQKDWADKLKAQERDYAMREVLNNTYKAKDILSVLPHLKQDSILFADGKFTGLDEQMKTLQKDKSFLFETKSETIPAGSGGFPAGGNETDGEEFSFNFGSVRKIDQQ